MAAALLALSGCRCGAPPFGYYTDVKYTPDGRALLVSADKGIYLAVPPSDDPDQITDENCGSVTAGLSCLRLSPDGHRFAALFSPRKVDGVTLYRLVQFAVGDGAGSPVVQGELAADVLDAVYSPDGRELVWVRRGQIEKTVAISRLGPAGEEELIASIAVDSYANAMDTVAVTNYGVAYPRAGYDTVEVWFRPFDDQYLNLGNLPPTCAGTVFGRCIYLSPDGASFAWQEKSSSLVHVFRAQSQVDLPLGQAYFFAFTATGSHALRLESSAAHVQRVDTAKVVRSVPEAKSADISADGETLAWTVLDSRELKSARLFIGSSRREGQDRDLGVFAAAALNPLLGVAAGIGPLKHAFTGDARYALVAVKPDEAEAKTAKLVAVNADTGEQTALDDFTCTGCCVVAPAGALVVCLPEVSNGAISEPVRVELYDPGSGRRTTAANKAIDVQVFSDGSGVAVLDYEGKIPELKVATKDGRVRSAGSAVRLAVSPRGPEVATISATGTLSVEGLP